jgi:hypothetical protein
MRSRGRRSRSRRGGGGDGRKGVQTELVADAGVGGITHRPLQVGGVLDGEQLLEQAGGVGVLGAGADFGPAFVGLLRHVHRAKSSAHGDEGGGVRRRPAFEQEGGLIRDRLQGGDDDVGAAQHGAEVVRRVDAHLKFLMQFHVLSGKGELGGLARLRNPMLDRLQIYVLRRGQVAKFAVGSFLGDKVGIDGGEGRRGGGGVANGQARGDGGIGSGGGDDKLAVVREDGYWEVGNVVAHGRS